MENKDIIYRDWKPLKKCIWHKMYFPLQEFTLSGWYYMARCKKCELRKKKNKCGRITDVHRKKMLQDFFNNKPRKYIYDTYWYTKVVTDRYLDGRASALYTDADGKIWKRCSQHRAYLSLENFTLSGKYYMSRCKKCETLKKKNKKQVMKNIGLEHEVIYRSRLCWYKNKWKYNTRRKILQIIWYLDVNSKIIKKPWK
jgi:hypothetical protein